MLIKPLCHSVVDLSLFFPCRHCSRFPCTQTSLSFFFFFYHRVHIQLFKWCNPEPIINPYPLSASDWLLCLSAVPMTCTGRQDQMHLTLNPALWVITSLALRWHTAAVMFRDAALQCFLTLFTDIHHCASVFTAGGELPAASYKLSDSLSYPPCLVLNRTPKTCGQWLRSSFVHPVHAEWQYRLIANGLLALWINFLWQLTITAASCLLQRNTYSSWPYDWMWLNTDVEL